VRDATLPLSAAARWKESVEGPPDLDKVFARYLDPIYRFLYSRVGNPEDAEDLTSEVFLKATNSLDHSRSEASIAQWLFTVARTVLADHWRRYYRAGAPLPLDDQRASEIPSETADSSSAEPSAQRALELLAQLPERYRNVLELRFLRGYSIQETAQELGLSPNNVKVIQHRALAKAVEIAGSAL
jgi:RNA polymerase sigma-70 factor (ECF subfamily)